MLFYDVETDELITVEQLKAEYESLKKKNYTETETFGEYIQSCLRGTLEIRR